MANWCENIITFKGGKHLDQIKTIINKNPNEMFQFEDFGLGAKHGPSESWNSVDIYKHEIKIRCLTRSSPPVEPLEDMSLMFPGTGITLQYCEAAMCFAGESTFEAGLEDEVSAWSYYEKNWYSEFYKSLEDEEEEALIEELDEANPGPEMKELMDKVYNKNLSDFMFEHFGGPVGG